MPTMCVRGARQLTSRPLLPSLLAATNTNRKAGHRLYSQGSSHVIFSGIQPTGIPHLGNYLGALEQWVKQQNSATPATKLIYSIVDLHAITTPQDPQRLRQWKRETLAILLAVGLDPVRSILFYQSSVSQENRCHWQELIILLGSSTLRAHVDPQLHRVDGLFVTNDTVEGDML